MCARLRRCLAAVMPRDPAAARMRPHAMTILAVVRSLSTLLLLPAGSALDNGLGRTPPMGFNVCIYICCATFPRRLCRALLLHAMRMHHHVVVVLCADVEPIWLRSAAARRPVIASGQRRTL